MYLKIVKIYALIDPITKEIRYIGQTSQELQKRLYQHWRDRNQDKEKNQYKANWICKLHKEHNLRPEIILIEEVGVVGLIDDSYINSRERHWIEYYYQAGCKLTNTSGKMYFRNIKKQISTMSKKVFAYNRNFEEFEFPSARAAEKYTGIAFRRISDMCNYGEHTSLDFCFSFNPLSKDEVAQRFILKHRKGAILATNIQTQEKIVFESQMDAARYLNCNFRNINQVLKNIRRSCKGYFFSYID